MSTAPKLHHRRVFDPATTKDVMYAVGGEEITLEDAGAAPDADRTGHHWEEAWLPEGSYWWLRLSNDEPQTIEFISWLKVGGEFVRAIVTLAFAGRSIEAVLEECERYEPVPRAIYQLLGLDEADGWDEFTDGDSLWESYQS